MKNYLQQLRARLPEMNDVVSASQLSRACERIDVALGAMSFESYTGGSGFNT